MKYKTNIIYNNKKMFLTNSHDSFKEAENFLLSESELKNMISGRIIDIDGEQIAEYMGEGATINNFDKPLTKKQIEALPESEALLYLAHRDIKKQTNKCYDKKYQCGKNLIN